MEIRRVGSFGTIVVSGNTLTVTTKRAIHSSRSAAVNVATAPKSCRETVLRVLKMTFCLTVADLLIGSARAVGSGTDKS